ncbi:glycosyltransferase involved in cell wall biosynthesis [Chitinophaga polysaccharea]|uniref:Glycosyltransferase involved in cell wall biosynthesis n=1 Tax=Chitinophaga polysaccharea TaxID=1293035 RepID=A0A561P9R5_9BACT|nr:glycosyltransferase [Chitinophaga polysaccharea]TWF34808.1 glycosyltransferase involved in cell wall biosynthesis [Chitinophaga polysaccharea]
MKILFIVPSYKPAYIYGGPIVVIARLAEQLVLMGHAVEVYTTTANGREELDIAANSTVMMDGVKVTYFKRITGDHTHVSPALWKAVWTNARQFDKIHIHSWWNFLVIGASFICKWKKLKPLLSPHGMFCDYVFTARNNRSKQLLHTVVGKRLLRSTYLHVSSELEWKECKQVNKEWEGGAVFNLVDLPDERYARTDNSVFTISFLSRVDPKKGLDLLIRALSRVSFPYRLMIAGTGDEKYMLELKALITSLDMDNNVEWVGWKGSVDKFHFLAATDLFALTSRNENFAIVVIEALYTGTPVLISDQVGLAGYVAEHDLGWVTPIDSVEAISKQLNEAYRDKLRRLYIARHAPGQIRADFNDASLASSYVQLYEKCI